MIAAESAVRQCRRRCYLVRHGHVEYFDEQGSPVDPRYVSLSSAGVRQTQELGRLLQHVHFDRALCSDYPRARETLELLVRKQYVAMEPQPEFREIRSGRLREIPAEQLREQVVGAYCAAANVGARFLGGERWDEFQLRVLGRFFELLQDPSWRSALIVSHDAVHRVLLGLALGVGLTGIETLEQDTGCLNVVDIDMQGGTAIRTIIRTLNFTPYDPLKANVRDTVLESLFRAIEQAGVARPILTS